MSYSDVLKEVIGTDDLHSSLAIRKIMNDFNEIDNEFEIYGNEDNITSKYNILKAHRDVRVLYNKIIINLINEFVYTTYNSSIDFVLVNKSQEEIMLKLEIFMNNRGLSEQLKCNIKDYIRGLSERLNKRFCFDEMTLINLIEASKGKNIVTEEGNFDRKILAEKNGIYYLKDSLSDRVYTQSGENILEANGPERKESSKINVSNYPLGNKFKILNTDDAMKKVMEILFENLNLCIETYNSVYCSGKNVIDNTVKMGDGSLFNFRYNISEKNIPHLLGFGRGDSLNPKVIETLNYITILNNKPKKSIFKNGKVVEELIQLNGESSALDVFNVIYANQKNIIESCGLYEENGMKYEIMNWEKIILKTTAFMRGDFFKKCFCLARLAPYKKLVESGEMGGFVTIASTKYSEGELTTSRCSKSVLYDLLNNKKQRNDFIFRGFTSDFVPNSLMTGKAETIRVGNKTLKTLQTFRNLFTDDSSGSAIQESISSKYGNPFDESDYDLFLGSIVEEIENEKFIRKFTPEEQAELGISISRDLNFVPHLSNAAMDVLYDAHDKGGNLSDKEISAFENARENRHTKR